MDSNSVRTILVILSVSILLPIVIKKFFSPPGAHKENLPEEDETSSAHGKRVWAFIAMQYYALILNRTYKVFVTDEVICGVRVMGVIANPKEIGSEWQKPEFYVNKNLEKKYPESDFQADSFLSKDKANFLVKRKDILTIKYMPKKWGMGQVPYSGRLILVTKQGNVELILLGKQDASLIKKRLLQ